MATILHRPQLLALPRNTPQKVCRGMGWVFLATGVFGFVMPSMFGMHLGFIHSVIHIGSGVLALWMGQTGSADRAANFSLFFGSFYAFLGVIGFVFGDYGVSAMGSMTDVTEDRFLLEVIPGWLEFGSNDHVFHVVLGAIFLLVAVLWKGNEKSSVERRLRRHMDGY